MGVIVICIDLLIVGMVAANLGGDPAGDRICRRRRATSTRWPTSGPRSTTAGCQSAALSIGKGEFVVCEDWTAITNGDSTAKVVSLYAAGNPVIDEYSGPLPQSLHWGQTITEVTDALGKPSPDHGHVRDAHAHLRVPQRREVRFLELQFNEQDELFRINACLTH